MNEKRASQIRQMSHPQEIDLLRDNPQEYREFVSFEAKRRQKQRAFHPIRNPYGDHTISRTGSYREA